MTFHIPLPSTSGSVSSWALGLADGLRQLGHAVETPDPQKGGDDLLDLLARDRQSILVAVNGIGLPPGAVDISTAHEAVADRLVVVLLDHPMLMLDYLRSLPAGIRVACACATYVEWFARCWPGFGRPFFLAGAASPNDAVRSAVRDGGVVLLGAFSPVSVERPSSNTPSGRVLGSLLTLLEVAPLAPLHETYLQALAQHGIGLPEEWGHADRAAMARSLVPWERYRRYLVARIALICLEAKGMPVDVFGECPSDWTNGTIHRFHSDVSSDARVGLESRARWVVDVSAYARGVGLSTLAAMSDGAVAVLPTTPWVKGNFNDREMLPADCGEGAQGISHWQEEDAVARFSSMSAASMRAVRERHGWRAVARRLTTQMGR